MIDLYLQNETGLIPIPSEQQMIEWVQSALQTDFKRLEQVVRVVDEQEIRALNKQFRHKDSPTNILSFPAESHEFLDYDCLGDLVVCPSVVEKEAMEQHKSLDNHWAHLIIHGMLHLQGYDHITEAQAEEMESLEIKILQAMGIPNPYNSECVK